MAQSHEEVLRLVEESQKSHELSIIKLSEPISSAAKSNGNARTSDVSAEGMETSPASLEADLTHYKACVPKEQGFSTFDLTFLILRLTFYTGTIL